jgi:hypothetical protein
LPYRAAPPRPSSPTTLCRYKPIELAAFLSGQKNWLLSEFIQMAPNQFIDEIASEITGYQFMTPNTRAPE